jgi:hypothetical protein
MKRREVFRLRLFEKALASFAQGLAWSGEEEWKINVVVHRFILAHHQAVGALEYLAQAVVPQIGNNLDSWSRYAATQGWIEETELWTEMRENRNNAAHPYLEDESAEIYVRCGLYYKELQRFYEHIKDAFSAGSAA